MLNIEILKLEDTQAEVKASISRRNSISEPILIYQAEDIRKEIEKKLKKENKDILSCNFLTETVRLKNKLDSHITEQIVVVKLIKPKPVETISKPAPKPKPKRRKKSKS